MYPLYVKCPQRLKIVTGITQILTANQRNGQVIHDIDCHCCTTAAKSSYQSGFLES